MKNWSRYSRTRTSDPGFVCGDFIPRTFFALSSMPVVLVLVAIMSPKTVCHEAGRA
ncbi:hypothetical protein Mal48_22500 [Thalassoglobus polymorphus]|uniref:Uncharacterized protein n=1 Tax=Thalassoglobus polymorphus TaxID=2527994 RepID=A0A517QMY1_9PLAN|nr:hypothetical protein Mal48_22500 [Thalassoglobus polymorphus]